jgi:hypothetical protein
MLTYKIGYSERLRRIVFPSVDDNYRLNFWTARTISDRVRKKW